MSFEAIQERSGVLHRVSRWSDIVLNETLFVWIAIFFGCGLGVSVSMFDSSRYRSVISLILAIATVFIVGCSSAPAPKPVYSPEQINLIGQYQADLDRLRSRIDELPELIAYKDWTDVRNLIHGPLGDLRFKMLTIARNLSSSDQVRARDLSSEVFRYLVELDAAAEEQSTPKAVSSYNNLVNAYERFITTIPKDAA